MPIPLPALGLPGTGGVSHSWNQGGVGAQLLSLYINLIYEKSEGTVGILMLTFTPLRVHPMPLFIKSVFMPNFSGCVTSGPLVFGPSCHKHISGL